jgi:Ca2+-binding RTX toxin-like protein
MSNTYSLANGLSVETALLLAPELVSSLEQSLILAQDQLQQFANGSQFSQQLAVAFGLGVNGDALRSSLKSGDYSVLSRIEVIAGAELGGAKGAYGAETDRIYLSQDFLQANRNNPSTLVAVLLEEAGHRLDMHLNAVDSNGDEGKIFSRLVQNIPTSDTQLRQLHLENDSEIITVHGNQQIGIEHAGIFKGTDLKQKIKTNLNPLLNSVQSLINTDVLKGLPILGDQLGKDNPLSEIFDEFRDQISQKLDVLDKVDPVAEVRQILFEVLHDNIDLLRNNNGDSIIDLADIDVIEGDSSVTFKLKLGQSVERSIALDENIGLPALGLKLSGGVIPKLEFEWNLEFGVDTNTGFFVNTAGAEPELKLKLDTKFANATKISGSLGFLQLDATDKLDITGKGSSIRGEFSVDLESPDNRLDFDKLKATPKFVGNVDLNLGLAASFGGSSKLPKISTDFNLDWGFTAGGNDSKSTIGVYGGDSNNAPSIAFDNVSLDVGSFFKDFAGPTFGELNKILEPIRPIIKVLKNKVPILNDLSGLGKSFFDKYPKDAPDGEISLLDLIVLRDKDAAFIDFLGEIDRIDKITKAIDELSKSGNIPLKVGSFNLGNLDPRKGGAGGFDLTKVDLKELKPLVETADNILKALNESGALEVNGKAVTDFTSLISVVNGDEGDKENNKPQFPILTDPNEVFKLLLGQDAEFFKYTLPQLKVHADLDEFFGLVVGVNLKGLFDARVQVAVGYDSYGIRQFAKSKNSDDIFDGFYIDTSKDPKGPGGFKTGAEVKAVVEAHAALDVVIATTGLGGGIEGTARAGLNDPNNDNKLRIDEFTDCIFKPVEGKIIASLTSFIKVNLGLFKIKKKFNIAKTTLLDFSIGCDSTERAETIRTGSLATILSNGNLSLNMGVGGATTFNDRILNGQTPIDDDESFTVSYKSGDFNNARLIVGYSDIIKEYGPVNKIVANGGAKGDSIVISDQVFTPAELRGGNEGADEPGDQIFGGSGNDSIFGEDGEDALFGGGGNDKLEGGNGEDLLNGGKGADTLDGGADFDIVSYYKDAVAGVTIINSDGALQGTKGEATGDRLIGIEQIEGTEYKDSIEGDELNNVIEGFGGDDYLSGGNGDDVLIGGLGGDKLVGGEGSDWTSYYSSQAGVVVNLATGKASGGEATGDKLTSIENVGGSIYKDILTGNSENNYIDGFFGGDIIKGSGGADTIVGGGGVDTATYENMSDGVYISLSPGKIKSLKFIGSDTVIYKGGFGVKGLKASPTIRIENGDSFLVFDIDDNISSVVDDFAGISAPGYNSIENLTGSNFNDTLIGDQGTNILKGLGGNDILRGEEGNDILIGGAGADVFDGGGSVDTVDYSDSNTGVNVVFQGVGSGGDAQGDTFSQVNGVSSVENLIGSRFADSLTADGSLNIITPGLSNGGIDVVNGGGITEIDTMNVDYSQGDYGQGIVGGYNFASITTGSFARLNKAGTANLDAINFTNIERLVVKGTFRNDTVRGGMNNDILITDNGDDLVYGGLGSNYISAGAGNDTVIDQTGILDQFASQPVNTFGMYLDGGRGIDTLSVDLSGKTAFGITLKTLGVEIPIQVPYYDDIYLVGLSLTEDPFQSLTLKDGTAITNFEIFKDIKTSRGNDVLTQMGRINNNFSTGFGDDTVNTGLGIDVADGGGAVPAQNVDINDGVRNDPYAEDPIEQDLLIIDYSIEDNGTGIISEFNSGYADLGGKIYRNDVNGKLLDQVTISRFEQFRIKGTSKGDQLVGGYYGDALTGNGGDDIINANEGDDVVNAGDGNDRVIAGAGNDVVNGGVGNDLIRDAEIVYRDGTVFVGGGGGNDTFSGGAGNDFIVGGTGNDLLKGDEDNDTLIGANAGANQLGTFNDFGGFSLAPDILDQIDTLTGGAGADEFWLGDNNYIYYDDQNFATAGRTNYALITDFKPLDTDVIQLYGSQDRYVARVVGGNTEILKASRENSIEELIGILQGVTTFDLGASYVRYVPATQPLINNLAINNFAALPLNQNVAPIEPLALQPLSAALLAPQSIDITTDLNSTRSFSAASDSNTTSNITQSFQPLAAAEASKFVVTSIIDKDPLKTDADIVRDSFFGTTTGLSNFKVNLNGNSQAFGTFANDPFGLGAGLVLSTGKIADLAGANAVDGGFSTGTNTKLKFTKLAGQSAGSAVFVANLSNLGFDLKSLTFSDSGSLFGGSDGYFTGFDLDAIRLSNQMITNAMDINLATPIDVFDFSPAGTKILTIGTQRVFVDPANPDLYGTINGYINNGIATLADFDFGLGAGGFTSLGDNGKIGFDLTSTVSTDALPLYLYVAEAGDNKETPDGLISASNREVGGLSDLSTDFGLPGVADDTISMEIEFNADANTKNVYFQFAFGSEELLEYAREFNDSFSLELNGVNLATLRDGKEVTIDNLAVNSIGPYSPDLIINPASAPVNNDVKLDGYTKTLTFTGEVNPNSVNKLVITVKDNRDGLLDSAVFLKAGTFGTVAPLSLNSAPTGKPTAVLANTTEDTDVIINESELLLGFKDPDGDKLSIANLVAKNGTLVNNGNNSFTFTPTANFNGAIDLTYDVTDSITPLIGQQQSFLVTPVNDAPTGSPTATLPATLEDTVVTIKPSDLLIGFSDVEKDTLTIKNLVATNGKLTSNPDGTYSFNPAQDFNGVVNLTYDVTDGIETLAGQKQSFIVTPVNDGPGGKPTAILPDTLEDTTIKILASELLKTFTDIDGTNPTISNLTATNGILTDNNDGSYTFKPTDNFNGVVNLSYDVTDGLIALPGQKQSFKVTPVNDAPTGAPTATLASTPEDTSITIKASDLLAGFSDIDGDTLTIANASATNGSLVDNKNGTYKFTPTSKFSGTAQITYGVTDGIATLAGQTRSFEVIKANRPPTAIALVNTLTTLAENTAIVPRRKVADIQITDDGLGVNNLSLSGTDSGNFELDGNTLYLKAGTVLDYEVKKNLNLLVNVDDATVGVVPDASTPFTLTITDVNEAPVRNPDSNPPRKLPDTPEDTTITIKDSDLLGGFSDADGNNTLGIKNLNADNGKLKDNKDGTYTFTPNTDYSGVVKLTYDVTDGTNTLAGQTDKFNVIAEVPALLAPITGESGPSGLLQLSKGSSATTSLLFSKISHLAENRNELGVFAVDDSKGTVNGLLPGQNGYIAEVAKRSQVVFSSLGENTTDLALDGLSTRNLNVAANSNLGFYLGINGSIDDLALVNNSILNRYPSSIMLFSFVDNNAQVTQVGTKTQIAFEDAVYGDKDFNDLVFQVETVTKAAPLGVSQQGTKEILDLRTVATPVAATFEIKRDAFYNNRVGFYKIEDFLGTIKVGTTLIKPGEAGYRESIVQGRIAGIDLAGTNGQTVASSGNFAGGALYAPFLIADTSNTYTDSSNVYTAYSVGNADKVDHIRLLADNTFGFEDLFAGGDRDFNDIIVSAKFTV